MRTAGHTMPHRRSLSRHVVRPGEFYLVVGMETDGDLFANFVVVDRGGNVFAVNEKWVKKF